MTSFEKFLYLMLLPVVAVLSYPPEMLVANITVVLVMAAVFIALGAIIWRRKPLALTFGIFLQGMNVILRIMMFFTNSIDPKGVVNWTFAVTSLIGLVLSMYLLLFLDRQNTRTKILG